MGSGKRILYFGYGATKDRQKIAEVTGEDLRESVGAILEGYKLAYQTLDLIPQPVQDELKNIWGPSFKAYTLRTGEGIVEGVVWPVSEEGFEKIKEWESIGIWREVIKVKVRTFDNTTLNVYTEKVPDTAPISSFVDGLLYSLFSLQNLQAEKKVQVEQYYTQQRLDEIRKLLLAVSEE